jgi:hypothetical protein
MTKGYCCTNDHSHVNDLLIIGDLMKTHWGKRTKKILPPPPNQNQKKNTKPLECMLSLLIGYLIFCFQTFFNLG